VFLKLNLKKYFNGQNGVFLPTLTIVNKIGRCEFYYNFDVSKGVICQKKKKKKEKT
jgi:hypothetical protein